MSRYMLALLALAALGLLVGSAALNRVADSLALQCAKRSDGTDSAIVQCFERYARPIPEDMQ